MARRRHRLYARGRVLRLAPRLRVTGQRLDQRSEIVAGSMQKNGPHRGALSRHHR